MTDEERAALLEYTESAKDSVNVLANVADNMNVLTNERAAAALKHACQWIDDAAAALRADGEALRQAQRDVEKYHWLSQNRRWHVREQPDGQYRLWDSLMVEYLGVYDSVSKAIDAAREAEGK